MIHFNQIWHLNCALALIASREMPLEVDDELRCQPECPKCHDPRSLETPPSRQPEPTPEVAFHGLLVGGLLMERSCF